MIIMVETAQEREILNSGIKNILIAHKVINNKQINSIEKVSSRGQSKDSY